MKQILSQYQGEVSCGQESMQTGIPVVQYEETDWEFVRRMAGGMGLGIFCDERAENPMVWLGRPQGGRKAVFSANAYKCCVDECYYHNGQEMGKAKSEFLYYEVTSEENYVIGDYVSFKGQKRYLFAKRAKLRDGVLIFHYKFGGER